MQVVTFGLIAIALMLMAAGTWMSYNPRCYNETIVKQMPGDPQTPLIFDRKVCNEWATMTEGE